MAAVRYRTQPEASLRLDLEPRARAQQPLPVVAIGSFKATEIGFTDATARAEASRCFRCDAVYGCMTVKVVAGRGPTDNPDRRPPNPVQAIPPAPSAAPIAGGDR
jgi:hypothetical protein